MKILFNLEQYKPVDAGERVLTIKEAKCTPSGKPSKIELTFEDNETKRTLKKGGIKKIPKIPLVKMVYQKIPKIPIMIMIMIMNMII